MEKEAKVLECEFAFKCPQKWEEMVKTGMEDVHLCLECNKPVYFAETEERLEELKRRGECVAVWQKNPNPALRPRATAGMVFTPTPEQMRELNLCRRCGKKMPVNTIFCGFCGTKFQRD